MNDQSNTPMQGEVVEADALPLPAQLKKRESQFLAALPAHLPVERFMRVVLTACQNDPKLARADRPSFFNACMKAAQDGLLPDGREGALVIYSSKVNGQWVDKVSWMPMIAGLRKKVRNSGDIATWEVVAVHANDEFHYERGDDPRIVHRPCVTKDPGPAIAFYSIATLKSGEKSREVMSIAEVNYVRDNYSKKDRDGNFSPAWRKSYEEMAKKTVARRHSKVLPMSTDLDDLLRRDDDLYDIKGASDQRINNGRAPMSLDERLEALASGPAYDAETGEVEAETNTNSAAQPPMGVSEPADEPRNAAAGGGAGSFSGDPAPLSEPEIMPPTRQRREQQAETADRGEPRRESPAEERSAPARAGAPGKTTFLKDIDPPRQETERQSAPPRKADPEPQRQPDPPKARAAPPPRGLPKKGDDPKLDESMLLDLTTEGERRAAEGKDAFDEFEAGLNDYEFSLIESKLGALRRKSKNGSAQ